jgi:hypothetical protein
VSAAVEQFQAATENLAADTERAALALYAQYRSGQVSDSDTALLIAGLINRSNASAVSLADVWLAVQIEEQTGQPVPTVGVLPVDSSERLVKAATTILQTSQSAMFSEPDSNSLANDADMRLERLARSEVFETAQQATHDAMQKQPLVEGWVRHMDADPCQLCRWWWREGRIWPKAHPMPRHKGCNCQPHVVLAESVRSTGFTRQLERNR